MHFSAKRGIAIACRLSVCLPLRLSVRLSVTLVDCDQIGWNSSKLISPLVSLGCSLFTTQHDGSAPKGTPLNLGPKWPTPVDLSVGDIRSQIAAEWLQIAQRSQRRAYRKLPSLFLIVPSLTPYNSPPQKKRGAICPQHTRIAISPQPVVRSTSCFVLCGVFGDSGSNGAIYGSNKSKMAATAMLEKFQVAISPQPVVRSTSCLVIGWGFGGRRI